MTHSEFCYWLKGYLAAGGSDVAMIKKEVDRFLTTEIRFKSFDDLKQEYQRVDINTLRK